MNDHELSNPASREGYADDEARFSPDGQPLRKREYPVDRPVAIVECEDGVLTKHYLTPGPGPSSGVSKRDLELSKIDKQIEDIRLALRHLPSPAGITAAAIRDHLMKMELSVRYLKEHV